MATYSFYIYTANILSYNAGTGAFDFGASYSPYQDRYQIVVNDDDTTFNSTGDGNQTATAYDMAGNIVASGLLTVPYYGDIDDGVGGYAIIDHIEVGGVHVGYSSSDLLTPGTSYNYIGGGSWSGAYSYYESVSIPCFAEGVRIATPAGARRVEQLKPGDPVITLDHGVQPVLWHGVSPVSLARAAALPSLRPVLLRKGLFGRNDPNSDLLVSGDHRVLIADALAELHFQSGGVLAPAKALGQAMAFGGPVLHYHHIAFARHEIVRANGLWCESFFPGREALKRIGPENRAALHGCLGPSMLSMKTARPCLSNGEALCLQAMRQQRVA